MFNSFLFEKSYFHVGYMQKTFIHSSLKDLWLVKKERPPLKWFKKKNRLRRKIRSNYSQNSHCRSLGSSTIQLAHTTAFPTAARPWRAGKNKKKHRAPSLRITRCWTYQTQYVLKKNDRLDTSMNNETVVAFPDRRITLIVTLRERRQQLRTSSSGTEGGTARSQKRCHKEHPAHEIHRMIYAFKPRRGSVLR